ncbi:MAG: hypothetical protein ACYC6A_00710 [Armatimonadota bacterium]
MERMKAVVGRMALPEEIRELARRQSVRGAVCHPAPALRAAVTAEGLALAPGDDLVVSAEAVRAASGGLGTLGATFAGVALAQVREPIRGFLAAFLARFGEHVRAGHGLAFTGGQGSGKTSCLALLAEAAARWIPVERTQWDSYPRRAAVYARMPRLCRELSDFLPASERAGWEARYRELTTAPLLLLDEVQAVSDDARSLSLLLDLVDDRVSAKRPIFLAINARWDALTEDASPLVRQIREKLEGCTREAPIPKGSRRERWG